MTTNDIHSEQFDFDTTVRIINNYSLSSRNSISGDVCCTKMEPVEYLYTGLFKNIRALSVYLKTIK